MKAFFKRAVPYLKDALNLPVADVDTAVPYYEKTFGFREVSREQTPCRRVVLARDDVQMGLAENGGDPSQEGCFFEVQNIEAAFEEINGKTADESAFQTQTFDDVSYRAFFVVAPDGLCFLIAEPQK